MHSSGDVRRIDRETDFCVKNLINNYLFSFETPMKWMAKQMTLSLKTPIGNIHHVVSNDDQRRPLNALMAKVEVEATKWAVPMWTTAPVLTLMAQRWQNTIALVLTLSTISAVLTVLTMLTIQWQSRQSDSFIQRYCIRIKQILVKMDQN